MYVDNTQIAEPIAINAWCIGRTIYIELTDGRTISFPADRFEILSKATDEQLKEVAIRLKGLLPVIFSCHYRDKSVPEKSEGVTCSSPEQITPSLNRVC
jgi:hypothetical protein